MTKIFFDGGCRPNPGAMESAVVLRGEAFVRTDLGQGSSMQAEWLALLHAAQIARDAGITDAVLLGDSAAVIGQANGTVRCTAGMREYLAALEDIAAAMPGLRIRRIGRGQNLAGIVLARLHPR